MKKLLLAAAAVMAAASAANAVDLVTNGSFTSTTNGPGQLGYNTDATGWTVAPGGYTFLFASGTADTTGASGQYGHLTLWGPNNGSANGLPASSPDGGNYVAEDGAFQIQPIQQTINGLTAGDKYNVSFYWGGAQQNGFTGPTTEAFDVSLGSETHSTATWTTPTMVSLAGTMKTSSIPRRVRLKSSRSSPAARQMANRRSRFSTV